MLDTSGSMKGERIQNARTGALQLLEALSDADQFTFVPFSATVSFAFEGVELKADRQRAKSAIEGVYADGGTALYDAIGAAFDRQMSIGSQKGDKIHAVVVLTDGEDTNSRTRVDQLLQRILSDNERKQIRVFTIGYGNEANEKVLKQIADATQAKYFKGTPQNIRSVFREIATFF